MTIRATVVAMSLAAGLFFGNSPRSPRGFRAVNHVGIATADIEKSIHFYRDLVGMTLEGGVIEVDDNPLYNHIFGLSHVRAKGAMLRLGEAQLELWEFESPRGTAAPRMQPVNNPRINHICFEVADVQHEYERLEAAGVRFHYPPQDFGGPKAVYGRDPDDNVIELIQMGGK
jgi:catechol 2,3-dioxygenase-like lactoylglutathione lyase family enzyme